ncbi:uncharacterized protein B0H64DRAFT_438782 [Chaetomium fimeti]|uniref:Uncharacterized protein n=1 Tax=Chaetomium fimeti TaxID=1854472 RepID=A0AAE0LUS9_9PEZI|nr:hypothetical protein B0H64DRAFT_438782 [Chaetomium fimeti]
MKLTPIKVKGKGGQLKKWKPPPPPQARASKRRRDDDDEGNGSNDGSRRRRFKSKKPAAPLEELPTEILERIILVSRNLNILRSSLRIGYRFSSRAFLTELLEAAFAPTWDVWFGYDKDTVCHSDERLLQELGNSRVLDPDWVPGDPDFQSAVFACKWVNTALILEAQQKWYRRHGGPGNLHEHLNPLGRSRAEYALALRASRGGLDDMAVHFEKDWERFKGSCAELFAMDKPKSADVNTVWEQPVYMELHPLTRVPERLLTTPFNWETAKATYWLVRGGGQLLAGQMSSWELTKRGYDRIMSLADQQLILVLLVLWVKLRVFDYWPEFLLEQELDTSQQMQQSGTSADRKLWWWTFELIRCRGGLREAQPK